MIKGRINKRIIFIAIILILATIISVFAISNAIKANKVSNDSNVTPYKYYLVPAYYGYWKTGDSYFADVDGKRKNIGVVPSEHVEFDLTFPNTLIDGNYEIDSIIDFENYDGSWGDLNYNNMNEKEFMEHRVEYSSIWSPQAYIGKKNTEVTFTASFRLLNPKSKEFPGTRFAKDMGNKVYKCYLGVVIKYVDSDFVKDPPKWWKEHGGTGDVTVYVEHKDKETGESLTNLQKLNTLMGENLILSCLNKDGYRCVSSTVKGNAEKDFNQNNIDLKVGLFDYTTPKDGYLFVTFWYEEYKEPEKPKCDPQFDAKADDLRITMKRKDFENSTNIYFNNIKIAVDDYEGGHKRISGTQWEKVDGSHNFRNFDLYLKYPGSASYDFTRYDIHSNSILQSLNIPANKFTSTNTEKTKYSAKVEATLGVMCECGGFEAEKTSFNLFIDIVENQPPKAFYKYSTLKTLPSGIKKRDYEKAYIGKDVVIDNYCSDPNGLKDIDYITYSFKNVNNPEQIKKIKLYMQPWGAYKLNKADSFANTSIIFNGAEQNGSIDIQFTNEEEWEVSLYVQDTEGLSDTYTDTIRPEVLSLNPIAVIKDTSSYRYPIDQEFNGKQNRVIKLNSDSSYVASWLHDMDITIDHSKDMWEIEPLDGQNINLVKFERDINKFITGNILKALYEPLDIKMMFKEVGRYKIRLQVTDTEGNVSEWSDDIITIHEDLPPTIIANLNSKYYRNSSKSATIKFNALVTSNDDDLAEVTKVEYKFDNNNNGSFTDEILQTTKLSHRDVNINGVVYKEITLTSSKVGKYQFIITAKEDFKKETIDKYITDEDYKTSLKTITTEIDNTAPVGTLALEKYNNIDVKVLTTGLTGTRQVDVENNLNNLKLWLESENNIKVGNIELLNLANEKNGLTNEDSLTWKKVAMNGYVDNHKFKYAEIDGVTDTGGNPETDPNKSLVEFWYNMLPNGVYADGWNGIPVPNLYLGDNLGGIDIKSLKYKDINRTWGNNYPILIVKRDYYHLNYTINRVSTSINNYSIWGTPYSDVTFYSAITNKKLNDFDIDFDLNIYPVTYGEDSMGSAVFLFNVQDKNNYFAYSEKYYKNWEAGNKIAEIVQVKNGVSNILEEFHYTRKKKHGEWEYYETTVSRIRQVGNLLQAYDGGKLVFEKNINSLDAGGYLGISAKDGYTSTCVDLDIKSLTYIDNSSVYEAVNNLSWGNETDKYIINLVENNKLNELTDNTRLEKTASLLLEKEINLINIGMNSVNGTKLRELISKNRNNGTYIELGNISNNLNAAATYIKNKYNDVTYASQYLLLGDKIKYLENYSDVETDPRFSKAFKFYHIPTYFENNLGTIDNNNIWVQEPIETFNKTGKYTINYRVQDNPLYPDMNIFNTFNNYRKYSSIFTQDIYVHRKPIATYSLSGRTVTDKSYDLDHQNSSSKGIVSWEWYYINSNGYKFNYLATDKTTGENQVKLWLDTYGDADITIMLRVKDIEGAWSDWTNLTNNKPIANFIIDKDPLKLNAETQVINDTSYDKDGYALTNVWNVKKSDKLLFMSVQDNIDTQLNQEIIKNGVGTYEISLTVTNTKGVQSNTVTKSFDVVVYNNAPTVNFNLVSNENPAWTFPKILGLYTLRYRPTNTLFYEEYARFDTNVNDPNTDNTGFTYNWKLERFAVKDINNISGAPTNTYNYTTQFPFVNSFKNQGLSWGAFRITLNVMDKPPVPPYTSTDAKATTVTKNYYIVPEISLVGSFESNKSEIMVGDSIKLKAKANKMAETVGCNFNGTCYALSKVSEDSNYAYWEKNIKIPESITESGTYQLQFIGKTTYGGNEKVTREVKDNVPIDIVALKLINFRITNIVNHPYITFPYTKDMLISNLIPYKAGYYVIFQIDSKGNPDNVHGRIDVGNNGSIDQVINMTKVVTGDTETWEGRFYSSAQLSVNTVISIKLDCLKGSVTYNYNLKENWDGRSLIINGSALQDGRINLTN